MQTLKEAIRKARLRKAGSADDVRAFMGETAKARTEELFEELQDTVISSSRELVIAEIKKATESLKDGDKGDKGDKGDTGVGLRGKQGPPGKAIRGKQGPPGKDGIGKKGDKGDPGQDGRDIKKSDLLKLINSIDNGINLTTIKGLDAYLKNLQRSIREKSAGSGRKHGGGMTIDAGSNITLIRNSNGRWTIAATASGSSNIATELVTAIQSGENATIDLTQLSHTYTSVLFISLDGAILMPNGNATLPGPTWNQSGNTATVYNANAAGIYLIQYLYA